MNQPTIIVKDLLVKTREITVLDGISFSLRPGEHLAILGSAESGKTTLARAIAGKMAFQGSITAPSPVHMGNARIELVEQRYPFKNLSGLSDFYYQQRFNSTESENAPTIYQELANHLPAAGSPEDSANSIHSVLSLFEIEHLKDAPLLQLSSGEHKKFQLAKALLNPPDLLILDSPYTGLDISVREKLDIILKEVSEKGTVIVLIPGTFQLPHFITHTAHLEAGHLVYFGEKQEFDLPSIHQEEVPEAQTDYPPSGPVENLPYSIVVDMKNVSIHYGAHQVLEGLNWQIIQGEKWLLEGRNGAGKSSLLSMITGDHPQAYSNEITLFSKRRGSGESIWDIKQKTGYISPELHAYFDKNMSCFQAIGSGFFDTVGLFRKLSTKQHQTIMKWLEFLRLSHVAQKPLHSLSVSLQRMILLARAFVKNPPLLILDEPCQGLDLHQSHQLVGLVNHMVQRSRQTLIYVSHDKSNIPGCIRKVMHLEKNHYSIYSINPTAELAVA